MSISSVNNPAGSADARATSRQSASQSTGGSQVSGNRSGSQEALGAVVGVDAVSISSQAEGLQALENRIRAMPDSDAMRVSEVREKVSNGEYTIDSQRVADKIIAFEKDL